MGEKFERNLWVQPSPLWIVGAEQPALYYLALYFPSQKSALQEWDEGLASIAIEKQRLYINYWYLDL